MITTSRDTISIGGRRRAHLVTVIAFILVIVTPGLGLVLGFERRTISESEMRTLAVWPTWSWTPSALASWPENAQRYFEDHFALRNNLINWQSAFLWHGLHTSSSETVIAGKGDWLFDADDGGMEDYVQTDPFSDEQLERWRLALERVRDWLAARGIRYLFVIAPDKQMVYPEFMPTSLHRMHDTYRADQLLAYLHAHSNLEVLDLRPAIMASKPNGLLYHHYDTHWNDRGALVAYGQIAARLRQWFPHLIPLERGDFDTSAAAPSGDKTTMLGLVDHGKVTMPGLVPRRGWSSTVVYPPTPDPYSEDGTVVTEIRGRDLPRAVMFRDSFASRLIPFLSEHFSRVVYQWQNDPDLEMIKRERPDVVIQEFVGRHLHIFVPTPELIPDN